MDERSRQTRLGPVESLFTACPARTCTRSAGSFIPHPRDTSHRWFRRFSVASGCACRSNWSGYWRSMNGWCFPRRFGHGLPTPSPAARGTRGSSAIGSPMPRGITFVCDGRTNRWPAAAAPDLSAQAVADALEMERTRMARELHSGAGQTLAGIKVNSRTDAAQMPEAPEALRRSRSNWGACR